MEKQKLDKDAIKKVVTERIQAGDNYKQTRQFLDKSGIKYNGLKSTFYTWRNELFPEEARQGAIHSISEKKKVKQESGILSAISPKSWSKQQQKTADESALATVINDAMFQFIPCPNKNLTKEDVQEINMGGSVIAIVSYYTDINLSHPLIIFVTRTLLLVIKVRALCYKIQEKAGNIKGKIEDLKRGEWNPPPPEK